MEERLLVFGFSMGENKIVLAATSFEMAQALAFVQAEGAPLIPMNHCLVGWGNDVMQWNEEATMH